MSTVKILFHPGKMKPGRVPGLADMKLRVERGSAWFWANHLPEATEAILDRMKQYCLRWKPDDQCDIWCEIWARLISADPPTDPDKVKEFVGIVARNAIVNYGIHTSMVAKRTVPLSHVENYDA